MSDHGANFTEDDDGWIWFECPCGFMAGPFPGMVEATDEFIDHVNAEATTPGDER